MYSGLKERIRKLAFDLAWEERAEVKFKNWWSRKQEHDNLLRKLYELEKRQ